VCVLEGGMQSVRTDRVRDLVDQNVSGARALDLLFRQRLSLILMLTMQRITLAVLIIIGSALVIRIFTTSIWYQISGAAILFPIIMMSYAPLRRFGYRHGEWLMLRFAFLLRIKLKTTEPFLSTKYWTASLTTSTSDTNLTASQDSTIESSEHISLEQEVDSHEASMIRAILRLEETTAREIMVPRLDIVAAPVDTPLKRLNEMMLEGGHSRIPLFEDTIDTIVGIIHARDLLRFLGQPQEIYDLLEIARPPLFIPDSKPLDELLVEFQERRSHLAIAVDEYGGTAGVVSIEDLLEEIVGDIADEFDVGEPEIEIINDRQAVMDARVSLEQVNHLFSTRIEGEGFDTLGGLIYSELGRIPNAGDEIHSNGLRVQVVSTLGRRIKKVRVLRNTDS
jgi:CBS domain containing-hemolysin-like protein